MENDKTDDGEANQLEEGKMDEDYEYEFNDLSVSEIAEQMTYIDYQIFCSISSQ